MARLTNDDLKKHLLDKLSKEPTMMVSTAYIYAKNYVNYGEDVTKAWTTATQQASIIEKVKQQTWTKAYDSFKADYETRLKADMVAMLTELKKEIDIMSDTVVEDKTITVTSWYGMQERISKLIQSKIDKLKKGGNKNGNE
jgi:hypothetical protein